MYCYNCMRTINNGVKFCPYCGNQTTFENVPHHLPAGTLLNNHYIIGHSIGEGGFGITYIGVDTEKHRKVAVKEFFPSGFANRNNTYSNRVSLNYQNRGFYFKNGRERFLAEARNLSRFLNEDGIVDVYDFFTENDTSYIVMEFIEGVTLSDYIAQNGVFKVETIFEIMLPIMYTLDKMHSVGIIHRDISPDNIMFTTDGSLKLMDFGSARYFTADERKTMSIILKPGYAPYEQYSKNGRQGPWTDVYGLSATIYKCITGVTPSDSIDRAQLDDLKRPSQLGCKIQQKYENVLMSGLEVFQSNRCQSMKDFAEIISIFVKAEKAESNSLRNSTEPNSGNWQNDPYKTQIANQSYGDTGMYNIDANQTYISNAVRKAQALEKYPENEYARLCLPTERVRPEEPDPFDRFKIGMIFVAIVWLIPLAVSLYMLAKGSG